MAFIDWISRNFGRGSGIDNALTWFDKNVLQGLGGQTKEKFKAVGDLINDPNVVTSLGDKFTGAHLTGAEQEANAFTAQQAQEQRDWEERMANTEYQRKVADMQAAGLNPMMAAGGSGNSTPSGASASSVTPGSGSLSDLLQFVMLPLQSKLVQAQIKNIDADTENKGANTQKTLAEIVHINADTQRIKDYRKVLKETSIKLGIENQVSEVLKGVRIEQERMNLLLTDEQINAVHNTAQKAAEEIELIAEQIESEDAKQALMNSAKVLNDLNSEDKRKYLIYADALYKAQSDAERSNADDLAIKFAYDKALLTDDYAKAIIDKAKADGAISQNVAWSESLVRDLVEHSSRPDKYKDGLSREDWRILRRGLLEPVYLNFGVFSQSSNSGAITNR